MDMDITSNDRAKSSPEPDPRRISIHSTTNTKPPLSFTNGVLKRHRHRINTPPEVDDVYKECLKNHAAALGGHALDGCGEFMPAPSTNPTSLKCAACGCHRNFHRRETEDSPPPLQLLTAPPISTNTAGHVMEYQSQRRHHPLPSARPTSPYPPSPPPISSSYYPSSAPHILLALSTGLPPPENSQEAPGVVAAIPVSGSGRKRFRTKFSSLQKEKMYEFAERVGWKMQKRDDERINELCNGIGIGREVFKVWMHNNKSTFGKRSSSTDVGNNNGFHRHEDVNNGPVNPPTQQQQQQLTPPHHSLLSHSNLNGMNGDDMVHHHHHSEGSGGHVTTNGSFSSS